jgi:hypothetical protein
MNWRNILKSDKPRWSAFFSENDITEFLKEAKRKEGEDIRTHGFFYEQFYELSDKYNIPRDAAEFIYRSHYKDNIYNVKPITDIKSYNASNRKAI